MKAGSLFTDVLSVKSGILIQHIAICFEHFVGHSRCVNSKTGICASYEALKDKYPHIELLRHKFLILLVLSSHNDSSHDSPEPRHPSSPLSYLSLSCPPRFGSTHPMFAPAAGWDQQNCAVIQVTHSAPFGREGIEGLEGFAGASGSISAAAERGLRSGMKGVPEGVRRGIVGGPRGG
jgi:hypothetical protein